YLPPLRKRKEDIPLLCDHFVKLNNKKASAKVKGIATTALKAFMDYSWPGNIRELANAVEHAFVLCPGRRIELTDLPIEIREPDTILQSFDAKKNAAVIAKDRIIPTLTREKLLELLYDSNWNKAEVARRVHLSRASIWKYMKKWDIPLQPDPEGIETTEG
ncbi:MAG: diguanylate cyclase, partial [Desulfobacterales bacterium]|nr:diguanylate cyclase [Desulfobacterales bacterium]